ncbi:MAG: L,D-transpeptidase family protein [Rhodobacteraceae bacterium]|nr:L,D-transpeptidase family protein [Paracoccaceae bacterium]
MGTAAGAIDAPSAFAQAVAEASAGDTALSEFYKSTNYAPVWTEAADADRRAAFLAALDVADVQGLPAARYDRSGLIARLQDAVTERDRGRVEVEMSRDFLQYARDLQTGILVPSEVDDGMVRVVPRRDRLEMLRNFVAAEPAAFLAALPPQAPEYNELLKAKLTLEQLAATDAWGPQVQSKALKAGQTGPAVVQLRDRLIAMGYLAPTASASYDDDLTSAVMRFQGDHGLTPDGVAAAGTLAEVNVQPVDRLKSVIVAMERWRWINMDLGARHVWVNLADFSAEIVDDGKVTFETPAVIGQNIKDHRSPEFSDTMRFMDVNPTWNVPRSIVTKEYLPALQQNPNADGQLQLIDASGHVVDRSTVDFTQYDANTFPFDLKQPPSDGNALGLVKFMFPNKYNIYLHDTPSKYLFKREVRAFSHGCIRLGEPFNFAYTLLARQSDNPQATFKTALDRRVENVVNLEQPIPVHLVYFTAIPTPTGSMTYRRDIYGRDAEIFAALTKAGVALDVKAN